jgi:hypothetical protein
MKAASTAAAPAATGEDVPLSSGRRVFDYRRLFRVAVRHEYYGRSTIAGVFRSAPTSRTSTRMQSLGLLFRPERDGFSVLFDTARPWMARAQGGADAEPLFFETVCTGLDFVSITDLDPGTNPRAIPFHVSNRAPDGAAGDGSAGPEGKPDSAVALRPELQPAFPSPAGMIQVSRPSGPTPVAAIEIRLGGPEWRGRCAMPAAVGPYEEPAVSYEVVFAARRTFWRYHIVPRRGGRLDNLTIDPAAFLGPFEETLVNGEQAYRFLSKAPLPLARQSSVRWSLHGRRRDRMTRDATLVDRLPVPAVDQLGLLTDDERDALGTADGVCSEMFVYV